MSKRIINIWWDVVSGVHRSSTGSILRSVDYPYVVYKEKPIVRLRLVTDSSLTPYTNFAGTEEYSASIDNDYKHDSASALMCKTLDANINISGDWTAGGTADPTQGEWSIRLDADNSAYNDKIGLYEELGNTKLELLIFEVGTGDQMGVIRMPFRTFNVQDDSSSVPPLPASSYWDRTESNARFVNRATRNLAVAEAVVMSGGVLAKPASTSILLVDEEDSSGFDDLTSITGGEEGYKVTLFLLSPTDTITIKHGTGTDEIATLNGNDIIWTGYGGVELIRTDDYWQIVGEVGGSGDTGSNASLATANTVDLTIFDKTIYQRARLILTVEDSTRTNINDYEYPVGWDGTNAVDDGGDFRPWKGSAISGLAISFSVSGDNIICTLNNTSGGTLYYTYKIVDELILSQ